MTNVRAGYMKVGSTYQVVIYATIIATGSLIVFSATLPNRFLATSIISNGVTTLVAKNLLGFHLC